MIYVLLKSFKIYQYVILVHCYNLINKLSKC